jgi:hypothetical protein
MHHSTDHNGSIPGKIGETSLLDRSKARPPADFDMSIFAKPKESSGPAALAKSVYNTSEYLKKLREEDPWPEQMPKPETALKIANCRFLDPAPIDLAKPVKVCCDVAMLGIPASDESINIQLLTNYRESNGDKQDPCGSSLSIKLKPLPIQTVTATFPAPGPLKMEFYEPGTAIYLRAEATNASRKLSEKSTPIATIPGPTEIHRFRMSGMLFDLQKCFLLPDALPAVRMVVDYHKKHPRDRILILGHTGPGNEGVGIARAKAFASLLTNKWEEWLPWFAPEKPKGQRWGIREAQLILGHLKFYKGESPGVIDEATTTAIKGFQKSVSDKGNSKLEATGKLDSPTRKELLRAYFGLEKTTLAKSSTPVVCGCQGLVDASAAKGSAGTDDDRIEVLFCSPRLDPEPKSEAISEKEGLYPKWIKSIKETVDFEVHGLHIQVVNDSDEIVPNAFVRLEGPVALEGDTDEHGWITFKDLKRGTYKLHVFEGEDRVSDPTIEVPARATEPGTVNIPSKESESA